MFSNHYEKTKNEDWKHHTYKVKKGNVAAAAYKLNKSLTKRTSRRMKPPKHEWTIIIFNKDKTEFKTPSWFSRGTTAITWVNSLDSRAL